MPRDIAEVRETITARTEARNDGRFWFWICMLVLGAMVNHAILNPGTTFTMDKAVTFLAGMLILPLIGWTSKHWFQWRTYKRLVAEDEQELERLTAP